VLRQRRNCGGRRQPSRTVLVFSHDGPAVSIAHPKGCPAAAEGSITASVAAVSGSSVARHGHTEVSVNAAIIIIPSCVHSSTNVARDQKFPPGADGTIDVAGAFFRQSRTELRPFGHSFATEVEMNWDQVEGNWNKFKGMAQQQWGKLTEDDLDVIEGKRTELIGRLQERYGYAKEEAEREVETWLNRH